MRRFPDDQKQDDVFVAGYRKNAVIFAGICVSAMMQPTGDQRQHHGDRAQPRVEVTVRID